MEYLGCRSERGEVGCECRRVPGGVTLVPGVCTWHLAEVVVHRSSRRGSQRHRMEVVWDGSFRRTVFFYRAGPEKGGRFRLEDWSGSETRIDLRRMTSVKWTSRPRP